jgi:hypothetical protein
MFNPLDLDFGDVELRMNTGTNGLWDPMRTIF